MKTQITLKINTDLLNKDIQTKKALFYCILSLQYYGTDIVSPNNNYNWTIIVSNDNLSNAQDLLYIDLEKLFQVIPLEYRDYDFLHTYKSIALDTSLLNFNVTYNSIIRTDFCYSKYSFNILKDKYNFSSDVLANEKNIYLDFLSYGDYIEHSFFKNENMLSDTMAMYNSFLNSSIDICQSLSPLDVNAYVCNPNFARLNPNLKTLQLHQYFYLLNLKFNRDILKKLKERKLNLILIGLGGSNSCFWYFTEMLCMKYKITNLFQEIIVFEQDEIEMSNLPRIPLDYISPTMDKLVNNMNYKISKKSKLRLLAHHLKGHLSNKVCALPYQYDKTKERYLANKEYIYLGAPDNKTREYLDKENKTFYGLFHKNDKAMLWTRPNQSSILAYETYGKIDLTKYFLNMFNLTINTLKILSENHTYTPNEILYETNCKEDLKNIPKEWTII